MLNLELLGNQEAADYFAKRLDQVSDPLERGWQVEARTEPHNPMLTISRKLRGVTESYQIDSKLRAHLKRAGLIGIQPSFRIFLHARHSW